MFISNVVQTRLPLFAYTCETSTGKYKPYIKPYEANQILKPCNGKGVNIIDCKHPEKEIFLGDVNGLNLKTVKASVKNYLPLPKFIPILPKDFYHINPKDIDYEVVAISIGDLLKSPPIKINGYQKVCNPNLNEKLIEIPLFKQKKVILFLSGPDSLIEKIWTKSEVNNIFAKIAEFNFFIVTAINFSLFFGECPFSHALNLKKSLESFSQLEKNGINAIPHFYWTNKNHLSRIAEWLKINPSVNLITVNCQCYHPQDYSIVIDGINDILEKVGREINFLLEGPPSVILWQMNQISKLIHIAVKFPAMEALFHKEYTMAGDKLRWRFSNKNKLDLFKINFREYSKHLNP